MPPAPAKPLSHTTLAFFQNYLIIRHLGNYSFILLIALLRPLHLKIQSRRIKTGNINRFCLSGIVKVNYFNTYDILKKNKIQAM